MTKKDRKILMAILGLSLIVVATVGISYALFSYTGQGTTDNVIKTGNIKFLYTENESVGNGIVIRDALPISDIEGKKQMGAGRVFEFKVTGSTAGTAQINYEVTAEKMSTSTLPEDLVKLYLTETASSVETDAPLTNNRGTVTTFAELRQTDRTEKNEKTIYLGTIGQNISNYEKNFKLRMWISSEADFSPEVDENGNSVTGEGKYNQQTFSIKVNVYANDTKINTERALSYLNLPAGEAVTLKDGSKWYVLENSDQNKDQVTLLKETGVKEMAYDLDNTTTYDEGDSNNIGYYLKNTYLAELRAQLVRMAGDPTDLSVRLLTKSDIEQLQTLIPGSQEVATWLYNGMYWTSSVSSTSAKLLALKNNELVEVEATEATNAIRPVIIIKKSNLS